VGGAKLRDITDLEERLADLEEGLAGSPAGSR
jgi:hypothetical protein